MITGREAVLKLKVKINQLDTASNRTVRPEKALLFLNNAYGDLAEAKYTKTQSGSSKYRAAQVDGTAFQLNQITTDELNHLTKVHEATPEVSGNEASVNISSIPDYWIHLKSNLQVKAGNQTKWISNPNYCTLDTIGTTDGDPFNNTIASSPIMFFEENKIKILTDNFEILKHKISYYSKPPEITLESELNIPFIDEIIDVAAAAMLENWGDPRAQSKLSFDSLIDQK